MATANKQAETVNEGRISKAERKAAEAKRGSGYAAAAATAAAAAATQGDL